MAPPRPWALLADGHILEVRVTPRGGCDAVDGVRHDAEARPHLKLRVAAAPADGDAAVERLMATWLDVPKSAVAVTSSATQRLTRAHIAGDPAQLALRAETHLLASRAA